MTQNQKRKSKHYKWYHIKEHRILWTIIFQQIDNLDKFLETYSLLRLNQEEIEKPKRPIFRKEIESIMKIKKKNPSNKQKLELDGFIGEFFQTFEEEWIPVFLKLFQKIEEEGILAHFYETSITLIPKRNKDTTHTQKITRHYPWWTKMQTSLTKYYLTEFNTSKGSYSMINWGLFQGCKYAIQHPQINPCDTPH